MSGVFPAHGVAVGDDAEVDEHLVVVELVGYLVLDVFVCVGRGLQCLSLPLHFLWPESPAIPKSCLRTRCELDKSDREGPGKLKS